MRGAGVYSFQVVETFTAAPLNKVSGINDMELVERGGTLTLYTATRAGGGILALDVDGAMTLVDQETVAPGIVLPAQAQLELLSVGGAPRLVVTGANAAGLQTYGLEATGALAAPVQLAGGLAGTISAQTAVQIGTTTYLYVAKAGESTIHGFAVGATGGLTSVGSRVLDGALPGVDVSRLVPVTVGGETFLVSLSLEADVVRTFPLGPGGAIGAPQMLGTPQGLGIADPSAVQAVDLAGVTYLVVASVVSSSLTVIEVGPGGLMRVADHVVDTLDTRFAGAQALATVSAGDRVFVIAGGSDGGIQVLTLLPEGRLLLVGGQLDLPGLALDNISAIAARLVDGRIDVFVAGEGTGITRLSLDPGPLAPIQTAGPEDTTLTGTDAGDMLLGQDGNDLVAGGNGADILADGNGSDTLTGGAGADIHVLTADGAADVITDFQFGIDRIDLSAWGRIHALESLTITTTATGARITYGAEVLDISMPNGLPIQPGAFRLTDFVSLWHAPPPTPSGDGIVGSNQADLLVGTDGGDRFIVSAGADTINGAAGFDFLDLSSAQAAQRLNLQSARENSGLSLGHTHISVEGIIGSRWSDTVTGDAVDNVLDGGDGNDRIAGGDGADSLFGGLGADLLTGGLGADLLDGGSGRDRLSYRDAAAEVLVDLAGPAVNQGEATGDRFLGIEEMEGSRLADTLAGDAQANTLFGLQGDDRIIGRAGNDTLYGGDGEDTLFGGSGADFLDGDAGFNVASYADSATAFRLDLLTPSLTTGDAKDDQFRDMYGFEGSAFGDVLGGAAANERFWGLGGNDWVDGRAGADWLSGGFGNDTLFGGDGDDTLAGGSGFDRLEGGLGVDVVSFGDAVSGVLADLAAPLSNLGDARGDSFLGLEGLEGSGFADTLSGDGFANGLGGGGGNDRLDGRAGNDVLSGGEGDDVLTGGSGADTLDGGGGVDWASWTDAVAGVAADLSDWTRSSGAAAQDRLVAIENLIGTGFGDSLSGDGGGEPGAGLDRQRPA